jgi:DNA-binding MarR family transcriptional regulator
VAAPVQTIIDEAAFSDLELGAWRGLLRARAVVCKQLEDRLEADHGLSLSSYEVLSHVAEAQEQRMRMCELASSALLSRSGLTRLIDRLEREGLIERERCPSDARGAFAKLTEAGREKLETARETHLATVRSSLLSHLTDGEKELLATFCERLGTDVSSSSCCQET